MMACIKLVANNKLEYTRACMDSAAGPVNRASNFGCPRMCGLKSMEPGYVRAAC
jgi:hypothetical protein